MKKLKLSSPAFEISMTPVKLDRTRTPRLKLHLFCKVQHPSGHFSYEINDLWLEFETLDRFITDLARITKSLTTMATLRSIDGCFRFEIFAQNDIVKSQIAIAERRSTEKEILFQADLQIQNPDLLDQWYRTFSEFRR